jgi:hypothetical protein
METKQFFEKTQTKNLMPTGDLEGKMMKSMQPQWNSIAG